MWDKETWALLAQRAVTMVATKGVTQVSPHVCPEGMSEPEHQHLIWSSNEDQALGIQLALLPDTFTVGASHYSFLAFIPQLDNDDRRWTGGPL